MPANFFLFDAYVLQSSKRKVEASSLELFGDVSEAVIVVGEVVSLLEEGVAAWLGKSAAQKFDLGRREAGCARSPSGLFSWA